MSIAVVVGNPKAGSRTLRVAEAVADILVDRLVDAYELGDNTERFVIDLADVAAQLFDYPSQAIDDLLETVAASDVVIAASPTYKATYTGLLKVFFDRYGNNGLAGTVGVPVMTGAAPFTRWPPSCTCDRCWSSSAPRPDPRALRHRGTVRRPRRRDRRLGRCRCAARGEGPGPLATPRQRSRRAISVDPATLWPPSGCRRWTCQRPALLVIRHRQRILGAVRH